jgi:hypothetical protein
MGGKPRKKPDSRVEKSMLRLFEVLAVNELIAEEDRKFFDYMEGIENGRKTTKEPEAGIQSKEL